MLKKFLCIFSLTLGAASMLSADILYITDQANNSIAGLSNKFSVKSEIYFP